VFDHVVDIDRARLGITGHLASILTHIRYPKIERALWIDSVCINQADPVERGNQVTMMGDIYRRCMRDLAWLGDPPSTATNNDKLTRKGRAQLENSCSGENYQAWLRWARGFWGKKFMLAGRQEADADEERLERFRDIDSEGEEDGMASGSEEDSYFSKLYSAWWRSSGGRHYNVADGLILIKGLSRRGATLRNLEELEHQVPIWICSVMGPLFETRLWSRVWVVQELSCAKKVLLLADGVSLSWKPLSRFLACSPADIHHSPWARGLVASDLIQIFSGLPRSISSDIFYGKEKDRTQTPRSMFLLAIVIERVAILETGSMGCLDWFPNDIAISKPTTRSRAIHLFRWLRPRLFARARVLISCVKALGSGGASRNAPDKGWRTEGLPSWAVDFAAHELFWNVGDSYSSREIMFAGDKSRKIFSAGGDYNEAVWYLPENGRLLQLRGYLLGQIGPCGSGKEMSPR